MLFVLFICTLDDYLSFVHKYKNIYWRVLLVLFVYVLKYTFSHVWKHVEGYFYSEHFLHISRPTP